MITCSSDANCILIAEDDDGNVTDRYVELKSGIIRAWRRHFASTRTASAIKTRFGIW